MLRRKKKSFEKRSLSGRAEKLKNEFDDVVEISNYFFLV